MKRLFFLILFFIIAVNIYSQKAIATLDSLVIGFANQTTLHIQVQIQNNSQVIFPHFEDTIADGIEIVKILKPDTIKKNPLVIQSNYLITSFKDSIRNIPALPVIVNDDTLWTNALQILIKPLSIDSNLIAKIDTTQIIPIFDIKELFTVKYTFREFWLTIGKWIAFGIIIIAITLTIIWLIIKYRKKEPIKLFEKPKEPAHLLALRRLNKLREEKLHQKGKIKDFYTELSNIIRSYIEDRYNFLALESTSTEILTIFENNKLLTSEVKLILNQLFYTADMVKFAKFSPSLNVNEQSIELAEEFINKTKIEIVEIKENSTTEN
jgi:hypothetical protein